MLLLVVGYLVCALVTYLAIVAVEVKYLDLLDSRTDPLLSAEAMWSVGLSLLWPMTWWFFIFGIAAFLLVRLIELIKLTNIGYFHYLVGCAMNVVMSRFSSFYRGIRRKWRDYKNARAPAAAAEVSGQNQEGLEANAG